MIRVVFIPNILEKKNRQHRKVSYRGGMTVSDCVKRSGFDAKGCGIIFNGKRIHDESLFVSNGDEILIVAEIKAGIGAAVIAIFSFLANNAALIGMIAIAGISYAIQASNKPKMPSFGSTGTDTFEDSSPTYAWDGIRTLSDVSVPIPIIYGEHRCGGNIINQFVWNDGEKNYLNILLGLCAGEIESIDSIKINDNPMENFYGVNIYKRYGSNDQEIIPAFEDLHQSFDIGAKLTYDTPYVYTTSDTKVEAVEVQLNFPYGLYEQGSSGGIYSETAKYRVDYKLHTANEWTELDEEEITGEIRSAVKRVYRVEGLTAGQYDIRITKTSTDGDNAKHINEMYLQRMDEITTDDLIYPNTALLGIRFLATDQISGSMPTITAVVKGRKIRVPEIKNGESVVNWEDYYWDPVAEEYKLLLDDTVLSWDGETYMDVYSANPVWCMRDLLTNNIFGLGDYIESDDIDEDLYLEMSRYCEEKVEVTDSDGTTYYEKRFRIDAVIDGISRALDLVNQIVGVFRGMAFFSEGKIKVKIDKPENMVQIFGMGSIVENSFIQEWKSRKDMPNVIEIQYMDKDKDYKNETISVINETSLANGDPVRKQAIRLLTTRTSYALREGRHILNRSRIINSSVRFKAGIDAVTIQSADVIGISHDLPQYGYSGRILSGSTVSLIKLDRDVAISAGKTYKIQIQFADGTIEERTVSDSEGTYSEVSVSTPFSETPQAYDTYAFGENNKVVKPYRALSMQRDSKNEVTITAIEYDEAVYDDSAVVIPSNNYSGFAGDIPDVSDLKLHEEIKVLGDGTVESTIGVSWNNPDVSGYELKSFAGARVFTSKDGGLTWTLRGTSTGTTYLIMGDLMEGDSVKVAVVSISDIGGQNSIGDSPQDDIVLEGKSAPPGDVSGFSVSFAGDYLHFSWTEVADPDLRGYELRQLPFADADWALGTVIAENITGSSYDLLTVSSGQKHYAIKAVDTSGNYSDDMTQFNLYITDVPEQNIVLSEDYNLSEGVLTGSAERVWMKGYSQDYYRTGIQIKAQEEWDSAPSWWDEAGIKCDEPVETTEATYISKVSNLGAILESNISIQTGIFNEQGGSVQIYIAYSDTNADPDNWESFSTGRYSGRYFRFKLIIKCNDENYMLALYKLGVTFDVDDKTQEGLDINIADSGWTTISFDNFIEVKGLLVVCSGAAYVVEVDQDGLPDEFNVRLKDPANAMAQTSGKINYYAKGY